MVSLYLKIEKLKCVMGYVIVHYLNNTPAVNTHFIHMNFILNPQSGHKMWFLKKNKKKNNNNN